MLCRKYFSDLFKLHPTVLGISRWLEVIRFNPFYCLPSNLVPPKALTYLIFAFLSWHPFRTPICASIFLWSLLQVFAKKKKNHTVESIAMIISHLLPGLKQKECGHGMLREVPVGFVYFLDFIPSDISACSLRDFCLNNLPYGKRSHLYFLGIERGKICKFVCVKLILIFLLSQKCKWLLEGGIIQAWQGGPLLCCVWEHISLLTSNSCLVFLEYLCAEYDLGKMCVICHS